MIDYSITLYINDIGKKEKNKDCDYYFMTNVMH